jgi:hypothetical protein
MHTQKRVQAGRNMDITTTGPRAYPIGIVASGQRRERSSMDRNVFLVLTALVWVGVLSGFGTDAYHHIRKYGLD